MVFLDYLKYTKNDRVLSVERWVKVKPVLDAIINRHHYTIMKNRGIGKSLSSQIIEDVAFNLIRNAVIYLPPDVKRALKKAYAE